ncbi:hypothetical protein PINS_up013654 [Pythium insidiosum]|nr:hypothetical protein PINS_up013654 [Pythium insidiosum]
MYMRDVKILKLINEIYDHRYEELGDNNTDVKALWYPTLEAPRPQEADGGFVKYLHRYFLNRFGLKTLVEQQMRELIEGVQVWEELNEVKRFLGFIDGTLDDNSLHFFLHVRNATQPLFPRSGRQKEQDQDRHRGVHLRLGNALSGFRNLKSKPSHALFSVVSKMMPPVSSTMISKISSAKRIMNTDRPSAWIEVQELFTVALYTFDRLRADPSFPSRQPGGSPTEKVSHVADDGASSSDLSPAPSPMPPPPVPRTLGGASLRVGQSIHAGCTATTTAGYSAV